jgi:hypothetical protein
LEFEAAITAFDPFLRQRDPLGGLHISKFGLFLGMSYEAGIACGFFEWETCPGVLLSSSFAIPLWSLTGNLQIGYNPSTCSWYAQGDRALGSVFTNRRYTCYENSGFASIAGSSSGSRLQLSESPQPTGSAGILYLFVRPANKPRLRLLATKTFFKSQLECEEEDEPPDDNNPFDDTDWDRDRAPGTGGGDPQCLSYDGFRFECNFLGEAVWTRCQFQNVWTITQKNVCISCIGCKINDAK